jgi:hypothetical protein
MLIYSFRQIACDTNVKGTISFAGHDVKNMFSYKLLQVVYKKKAGLLIQTGFSGV